MLSSFKGICQAWMECSACTLCCSRTTPDWSLKLTQGWFSLNRTFKLQNRLFIAVMIEHFIYIYIYYSLPQHQSSVASLFISISYNWFYEACFQWNLTSEDLVEINNEWWMSKCLMCFNCDLKLPYEQLMMKWSQLDQRLIPLDIIEWIAYKNIEI